MKLAFLYLLFFPLLVQAQSLDESIGIWNNYPQEDEFGDLTGDTITGCVVLGRFSNDFNDEAPLTVTVAVTEGMVIFTLLEHTTHKVRTYKEYETFKGKIKDYQNTVSEITFYLTSESYLLLGDVTSSTTMLEALKHGSIKVYLVSEEGAKYNFTIPQYNG